MLKTIRAPCKHKNHYTLYFLRKRKLLALHINYNKNHSQSTFKQNPFLLNSKLKSKPMVLIYQKIIKKGPKVGILILLKIIMQDFLHTLETKHFFLGQKITPVISDTSVTADALMSLSLNFQEKKLGILNLSLR